MKHRRTVAAGVCRVEGIHHLEVSESCRKECMQRSFLRLEVVRSPRRSKAFENIEGHWKFVAQADKSREESLVSFIEIIKGKRLTVMNLWGGFVKSHQLSNLPDK